MAGSSNMVKVGAAVALLAGAVVIGMSQMKKAPSVLEGTAFFYDLTSGQLFPGPYKADPPIDAAGGPGKGVKAFVYACGECSEANRKVGYITNMTDEAKAMKKKSIDEIDSRVIEQGRLIALPPKTPGDEVAWVPQASAAGGQIVASVRSACGGPELTECLPTK